jgi:hypothetical protein
MGDFMKFIYVNGYAKFHHCGREMQLTFVPNGIEIKDLYTGFNKLITMDKIEKLTEDAMDEIYNEILDERKQNEKES